ncbi:SURF1 family cytochrome oxidase biogenesis protein [Nocardioides sambongensis]|uniref:SURF1 family cytochrome oxidase biogenesis protein n=1 Tax=Nocardioides sambongensis TaxID=2589074 RepID=UPI001E55FF3A|nr:SURF1 family protein [Nocardioides sambongensis]
MKNDGLLGSWRFLLSRRWVLFFLAVILIGYATWWLGEWQFGRLEDRKDRNAIVRANETKDPAPVEEVLAPDQPVDAGEEWRVVTATGTYDADDTVIVRYRTDENGVPGVDAVVPLVTADGTALLVDRGWYGTDDPGTSGADVPGPPEGEVTVTGWVRADGTGSSTQVTDQSTRAISSVAIGEALDREVYGGFVDLRSEDPEPAEPLTRAELPELDEGPHFFYGLQWWFFGVLAAVGFGYLAWDERRHGRRGERRPVRGSGPFGRGRASAQSERVIPPSTGSATPERNDAAGESRNAAARPNSSGSP